MNRENGIITINFNYALTKDEYETAINEMTYTIKSIKTKNYSEIKKVKFVYDYLADLNSYEDKNSPISQSAYSAFIKNKNPICTGYSKAGQIIFQNIGIPSIIVDGTLNYSNHEWNFVKIDGSYYWYDVTQSDYNKYKGYLFKNHQGYKINHKKMIPYITEIKHLHKNS